MEQGELQLELKGELFKAALMLCGIEIKLLETKEHTYQRHFKRFEADGFLDVILHLEATEGTGWQLEIKWNKQLLLKRQGTIGPYGYTSLKELIKIE